MTTTLIILAALILDRLVGEPKHGHPLVGFGKLAQSIEACANNIKLSSSKQKWYGTLSLTLLLIPITAVTAFISYNYNTYFVFDITILYLAIGSRSLIEHAQRIANALLLKRNEDARYYTSRIVSRDTNNMDETDMSRAAIESTLENGSDAIFAPLFWFVIGGAPAVVFYRLTNTLDAMWGYRTQRYLHFGWAAARLDDVLNYIPARLTALTYAILGGRYGHFHTALKCWNNQASTCKSPNGGPVMSAGAGALNLQLGGPTFYHGKLEECPVLGCGELPTANDILQATKLVLHGIYIWMIAGIVTVLLVNGDRFIA